MVTGPGVHEHTMEFSLLSPAYISDSFLGYFIC